MKAPFVASYATMQEKIDQMHLHCKSIDEENKSKDERNHCSPLVDNDVLISALNQRSALLEALERARAFIFRYAQSDCSTGELICKKTEQELIKIDAAIAAARGE